jgi:hypothetical protein
MAAWHSRPQRPKGRPAYSDNGKGFPSFKRICEKKSPGQACVPELRMDRWRPVGISLRLVRDTRMTVALLDDYATSRPNCGPCAILDHGPR